MISPTAYNSSNDLQDKVFDCNKYMDYYEGCKFSNGYGTMICKSQFAGAKCNIKIEDFNVVSTSLVNAAKSLLESSKKASTYSDYKEIITCISSMMEYIDFSTDALIDQSISVLDALLNLGIEQIDPSRLTFAFTKSLTNYFRLINSDESLGINVKITIDRGNCYTYIRKIEEAIRKLVTYEAYNSTLFDINYYNYSYGLLAYGPIKYINNSQFYISYNNTGESFTYAIITKPRFLIVNYTTPNALLGGGDIINTYPLNNGSQNISIHYKKEGLYSSFYSLVYKKFTVENYTLAQFNKKYQMYCGSVKQGSTKWDDSCTIEYKDDMVQCDCFHMSEYFPLYSLSPKRNFLGPLLMGLLIPVGVIAIIGSACLIVRKKSKRMVYPQVKARKATRRVIKISDINASINSPKRNGKISLDDTGITINQSKLNNSSAYLTEYQSDSKKHKRIYQNEPKK
jgi:hypothetical protein